MLSIGEFSKIGQVTPKTLHHYDEIGLLKPMHVGGENGYRYYDVTQLDVLLLIQRLKRYHFSLGEIATILARREDLSFLATLLAQKQALLRAQIAAEGEILAALQKDTNNAERGIDLMDYLKDIPIKLIETAPMNILFIRKRMNVQDSGRYVQALYETIEREHLTPMGPPMFLYHSEEHTPEDYDMEIAIPVREVVNGTRELPGSLCATTTLKGAYSNLSAVYSKMQAWMEQEGYTLTNAPYDVYMNDPSQVATGDLLTQVYFPVKK